MSILPFENTTNFWVIEPTMLEDSKADQLLRDSILNVPRAQAQDIFHFPLECFL
jgi:hypothetical protein